MADDELLVNLPDKIGNLKRLSQNRNQASEN